jgi:uncharacterized protein (DUF427 family)
MAKAIWNGRVIAESTRCEMVEGTHYNRAVSRPG